MLGGVLGLQACDQPPMDRRDSGRTIGAELFAQRQMQTHVQERIVAPILRRKVLLQGGVALQQRLVFGMRRDHIGNLCLERLHRHALAPLAPGLAIGGAQRIAALVGEQRHGGGLMLVFAPARDRAVRTVGRRAPCRRSGRAGSANDARAAGIPAGMTRSSSSSTARGLAPRASPVRLATRNTCVSTASVGSPKATLSTTFAVLRPTPGNASSASRVARHLAAVTLHQDPAGGQDVARLGVVQPDGTDVALETRQTQFQHRLRCARACGTGRGSPD